MSEKPNDGGWHIEEQTEIPLRDRFAGQAMQAIIAKTPLKDLPIGDYSPAFGMTAIGAYEYADAMLAEREKACHAEIEREGK